VTLLILESFLYTSRPALRAADHCMPSSVMSERHSSLSFEHIADRYDATRGGEHRGRRTAASLAPLLDPVCPVVEVADAAQLPIADATIEQAVSVWLLHLVADRGAVLAEVARALRPGGRYLVSSARVPVPPEDEIDQLLFDMRNQLNPGWHHDERQILDAASSAGFTVIDQRPAAPDQVTQSPAEIADGIEAKTWSSLWNLTNEQWQTVVAPTVAALRALPDAHVQRRFHSPQRIIVLQRR
jgi:SAM-dependent methyltransferase